MLRLLLRRLLHIHSPSLAMIGRDPVVSRRWAERCKICAAAFAPPLSAEELGEIMGRIHARAHLLCDCEEEGV